jgi:two-component system sensor histidine kinase YesM
MRKKFSFWVKMFVVSFVSMIITIAIVSGMYIYTYTNDVMRNSVNLSKDLLYSTSLNTDNYLMRYINIVDRRAINELYGVTSKKDTFIYPSLYTSKTTDVLQQLINSIDGIDAISFSDLDGTTTQVGKFEKKDIKVVYDENIKDMDQYEGRDIWRYYTGKDGVRIVFCRKLIYLDETYRFKSIGYISVFINEEAFYKKCLMFQNENIGMLIVNDKGLIVSGSVRENLGMNFESLYSPYINNLVKGTDGNTYEVLQSKSTEFNLNFKYIINVTKSMETINLSMKYILLIVFLCTIISGIISMIIYRKITRPITDLSYYMKEVGNGNYEMHLSYNAGGEIGSLYDSFNVMVSDLNQEINKNLAMKISIREAMLKAYESQVNPHFIYNTLELIRMMSITGNYDSIEDVVMCLGETMRYNLGKEKEVLIRAEIDSVEKYFRILKIRLRERFNYEIDIPDDIKSHYTIKFLLQPFIENAVMHGITNSNRIGKISIYARKLGDDIAFIIRDNGVGIPAWRLKEIMQSLNEESANDKHIGIQNVHGRIKLCYGENYGIEIQSNENEYTEVLIHIPAHTTLMEDEAIVDRIDDKI